MKIYTKTGDDGETGLFGGARVKKHDVRVEAYGEVDELNSVLGLARAANTDASIAAELERIQHELFCVGAELSTLPEKRDRVSIPVLRDSSIARLEGAIDDAESKLKPLKNFILPGGSEAAARFHHARTVCRRAERRIIALSAEGEVRKELIVYVNRLSDLLFVFARLSNLLAKHEDIAWVTD